MLLLPIIRYVHVIIIKSMQNSTVIVNPNSENGNKTPDSCIIKKKWKAIKKFLHFQLHLSWWGADSSNCKASQYQWVPYNILLTRLITWRKCNAREKDNLYKKSDCCPIQNYKMGLSVAICNFIKTYIFSIRQIKNRSNSKIFIVWNKK